VPRRNRHRIAVYTERFLLHTSLSRNNDSGAGTMQLKKAQSAIAKYLLIVILLIVAFIILIFIIQKILSRTLI